jgi:hypothetical protein
MYNLTNKIYEMLISDRKLKLAVALELGIGELALNGSIDRKSDNLTKYGAIKAIKDYTGLKEEEIIEKISA